MRRILVATDFSAHARVAAELAATIAARMGSDVMLYHAVHLLEHESVPRASYDALRDELTTAAERDLAELADALRASADREPSIRTTVEVADPIFGILDAARRWEADLIAIGTYGVGTGERFFFGSVSARVARDARCPVLVTRAAHAARIPKSGLFEAPLVAIDYSRFSEYAVALAAGLVAPDTHVELLHVFYAPDLPPGPIDEVVGEARAEEIGRLEKLARNVDVAPVTVRYRTEVGRVAEQILAYVEGSNTDLVVVGAHGRREPYEIIGTVADRVLRASAAPVILIPDAALNG